MLRYVVSQKFTRDLQVLISVKYLRQIQKREEDNIKMCFTKKEDKK
jgi:hypothetical protein